MNTTAVLAALNLSPAQLDGVAALLSALQQQADTLQQQADTFQRQAQRDALHIQALSQELARLKRWRFGARQEALSAVQRELFEEMVDTDCAAIEAELEQHPAAPRAPRTRAGRQPLPAHLPRLDIRHEPACCTCGECGGALVHIGDDITEQLHVEPARFTVHRHIRPQYACRPCARISAAPVPAAIIDGSMATPGLLSWVLVGKYLDHLPLYRLEQSAARHGVTLARSTLAEWVGRCGVALQPLADRLAHHLRQRSVLHADETPVPQLEPGRGRTKRAYLWVYRSNDLDSGPPLVLFDYQPGRNGEHARTFLTGWQGDLVVDDYAGYKALFTQGVREVGCMAHARRKFFDLQVANQSPEAAEALRRIAELYAIEARGRTLDASDRLALRTQLAIPALQTLHAWLLHTRRTTANSSALAKAIDYSLKRWTALSRYASSGNLPIDNNPVENSIRPIAIGKKNWLFTGSERAGRRAAAIQSLLATAKLNGLDPAAWLNDVLTKLPSWPNSRIDELLPIPLTA